MSTGPQLKVYNPKVAGIFLFCSVESIFLNGTGRRRVSLTSGASFFGILGEFLYWVDNLGTVSRVDKFTAGDLVVLATLNYPTTTGLQVFAKERQNCKLLFK